MKAVRTNSLSRSGATCVQLTLFTIERIKRTVNQPGQSFLNSPIFKGVKCQGRPIESISHVNYRTS